MFLITEVLSCQSIPHWLRPYPHNSPIHMVLLQDINLLRPTFIMAEKNYLLFTTIHIISDRICSLLFYIFDLY